MLFPDGFLPSLLDSVAEPRKDGEVKSVESDTDPKENSVVGDDRSLELKQKDIIHLNLFGSK